MDLQHGPETGSIPNAFRNATFWRWSREMPRALRRVLLTPLYALGSAADSAGHLRFASDRRPIRMSDLARAMGCDEKDARRYLRALVAAGVLAVEGEQGRGKRPTYRLLVPSRPDWQAAADSLRATERKRPARRTPPPWERAENGGQTPKVSFQISGVCPPKSEGDGEEGNGGQTPDRKRGADPRALRGADPRTSHVSQDVSHVVADVGDLPTGVAHAREADERDHKRYLDGLPMGGRPYRAAARHHLEGLGVEPTPEQIDAYAYAMATGSPPPGRPLLRVVGE